MSQTLDPKKISQRRLMRVQDSLNTGVFAEATSAGIVGNADNSMVSSDKGNAINGKLSVMAFPSDIRIGGMWKLNPLLLSTVPSTIVTPVPVLVFDVPGKDLAKDIGLTVTALLQFMVP